MRDRPWFDRFADIPGVNWSTPAGVDPTRLRGYRAQPVDKGYDIDSTYWPSIDPEDDEDGWTSATPAAQHSGWNLEARSRSKEEVLRLMAECLELPGAATDYHFVIANAAKAMWRLRFDEPSALGEMEKLCRLDLDLVRARPGILTLFNDSVFDDEPQFTGRRRAVHLEVCGLLYRLYLDEGYLREAEEVARQAAGEFMQDQFAPRLEQVEQRLAVLEAEDG